MRAATAAAEPPAESDFGDEPVDSGLAKRAQRRGGDDVEPGRFEPGAGGDDPLARVDRPLDRARERGVLDLAAVDRDALVDPLDVRRRVAADAQARATQPRVDQGRGRALALAAGDVDDTQPALGVA